MKNNTNTVDDIEEVLTEEVNEFKPDQELPQKESKEIKEVLVRNCLNLNIRERPNANSAVLEVVPAGSCLSLTGKRDSVWARVHSEKGIKGFVMTDYIEEK